MTLAAKDHSVLRVVLQKAISLTQTNLQCQTLKRIRIFCLIDLLLGLLGYSNR